MFNSCHNITELDLRNFDTSHVTRMYYMFNECEKLREIKIDSQKFKTSEVNSMSGMFQFCIDLKSLDFGFL